MVNHLIEVTPEDVFEKELSPEEWENPSKVLEKLESFKANNYEGCEDFLHKNEQRLSSFGGANGELIEAVIKQLKEELVK